MKQIWIKFRSLIELFLLRDGTEFLRDQRGTVSVLNLTWFAIIGAGAGFAIDVSNARQSKEHLTVSAEAASHAGLVALVQGGTEAEVRSAALEYVQKNIPTTKFGTVVANPTTDIRLLNWDPDTGHFSPRGTPNAVEVTLHRNDSTNNAVATFLLDMIGFEKWQFSSAAATVNAPMSRCSNTEGLFALGELNVQSYNDIGAGVCLYTADYVQIGDFNYFETGASLLMPDLTQCTNCVDDALNPGIVVASSETTYLSGELSDIIDVTQLSFLGSGPSQIKDEFFATKQLASDLSPLVDLGIDALVLNLGDRVSLSAEQFAALTEVPKGLTYDVTCAAETNDTDGDDNAGFLDEGLAGILDEVDDILNEGELTTITTLDFSAAPITDVAIITNCALDFSSGSEILGSTLLTTHADGVGDSAGAQIGASDASCSPQDRLTILSNNDIALQATALANNVTLIANGAINMVTGGTGVSDHYGIAMYSASDLVLTNNHGYYSCDAPKDDNLPQMEVIRQVNASG